MKASPAPVEFYRCTDVASLADTTGLQTGKDVNLRLWRPGEPNGPAGFSMKRAAPIYAGFHALRIFRNRDYSAMCIDAKDNGMLHASSIFPPYFRFPFMRRDDLQIGATYTIPKARGNKLAQLALVAAAKLLLTSKPDRAIWYLTNSDNVASIKTVEASGFSYVGVGEKFPKLGIAAFGSYRLTHPVSGQR